MKYLLGSFTIWNNKNTDFKTLNTTNYEAVVNYCINISDFSHLLMSTFGETPEDLRTIEKIC